MYYNKLLRMSVLYQDTLEDFQKFKIADCLENGDDITKEIGEEGFYNEVLEYVNGYFDNTCTLHNKRFFDATEFLSASISEEPDFELWEFKNGEFIQWGFRDVEDVRLITVSMVYDKNGIRIPKFDILGDYTNFYVFHKI